MQGKDNKKRGGRPQGAAVNAWGDHDAGSKSQSGSNLDNGRKSKEWLYRHGGKTRKIIIW